MTAIVVVCYFIAFTTLCWFLDLAFPGKNETQTRLVVQNTTTFSDFACLQELRSVEFLGIAGGYSKPLRADSLQPLAAMQSLRAIYLANIRLEDWDLGALSRLRHLELLYTPKWCPEEKVEALRRVIPALVWNWDEK